MTERAGALITEVMDGQYAGRRLSAPGHIGRSKSRGPVVHVQQVRAPCEFAHAGSQVCGGEAQPCKTDVVVGPFMAVLVYIRGAGAVVEFRADHRVHHQPIGELEFADITGGQGREAGQAANHLARHGPLEYLWVAGNQHADIVVTQQGTGQGRGDIAQAAGLDEI